jgi:hypothetical protein
MAVGKYFPFKRTSELNLTTSFTYILQIWLGVFAFSSFITLEVGQSIWGWWQMLKELSLLQWFAYVVGSIVVLFFLVMVCYSLFKMAKLFWLGKFGQIIKYDQTTPSNIISAIKPLENDKDLREYKIILEKLIVEKEELIKEYQSVINKLEVKNGDRKPNPKHKHSK